MADTKQNVKLIEGALALGFSPSEAITRAMGVSLSEFARQTGHTAAAVSMCFNFYNGRVFGGIRDLVAERLGVPREYIDRVIESQAEQTVAA